jgi:uncharacterized protein YbjT (DUF2867 family)
MFVVAGVTGHVGSTVASGLSARKQPVKVIVRDAAKAAAWSQKGAELAVGSLDDEAFLTAALRGARGFFALLPPIFTPDLYGGQRKTADRIAGAVKAAGVPHVVLLSSVGADLDHGNGPVQGLCYLENALRATGTRLTAVRAGSFQENVANSLGAARQAGIYPNFAASADYPWPQVATKDIGAVAVEALLAPPARNEVVDVIGPAYSVRQVAEKLGAALGKTLRIVDVPPAGQAAAMMQGGVPRSMAEALAEMYAAAAAGLLRPKGDRLVQGKTEIDETIRALLG